MLQPYSLYAHTVLELILAFIAAFGALLLWELQRYRSLAVFLLFQAALMLVNVGEEYVDMSGPFLLSPVFTLAKGPLLYLFIRSIVNETRLEGLELFRHFCPMLFAFPLTVAPPLVVMLGSASQIVYFAASFRLLHRYHTMARAFRADADELELAWVVRVFGLFTAQVLISLVRLNLQPALSIGVARAWFTFDIAFLLGLCCFMLFKVLKQPPLYDEMLEYEEDAKATVSREDQEAVHIFAGLEKVIAGQHLYRQPRLTVDAIARETGLQMKDISWAINLGSGQNFNEYINRLRVSEVKQQLQSGHASASSLLDLAFAAGFNSKSTFNAVFKRETGMTPTQFLQNAAPSQQMTTAPAAAVPHSR